MEEIYKELFNRIWMAVVIHIYDEVDEDIEVTVIKVFTDGDVVNDSVNFVKTRIEEHSLAVLDNLHRKENCYNPIWAVNTSRGNYEIHFKPI